MESKNHENNHSNHNQRTEHIEPKIEHKPQHEQSAKRTVTRTVRQDHMRTVLVAACTAFAVLIIALGLMYAFRTKLFSAIASDYLAERNESTARQSGANLFSDESIVTSAVKKTIPAVVAITISKDVPKYQSYFENNPFGFLFPFPQQMPNGTERQQVGSGSGFLVSEDGFIVTNRHVADDESAEYTVTLNDGKTKEAKVIAVDAVYDIAIIKIEGKGYPSLELGDSSTLELGSTVIAIGNALGQFKNTVSAGVVSGLSRSITAGDGTGRSEVLDQVIQTDAAINPGNSGGPLLNLDGEVVGVNVAVAQGSQSIGFALPINSVKGVIASVKETGKIVRPYIGVRYTQITPGLAERDNLPVTYGVLIGAGAGNNEPAVVKGSPADKAGLRAGDIITEIDGKKLDESQSLALIVREHKVGDSIRLKIMRGSREQTLTVRLEAAPEN